MGDYHPQGTMEKSVSIYLKRRSITGSCGAGHFIKLEKGSWRRGKAKEDSETLRKVSAKRGGGGGEGVTKDSLMTSTSTPDRRGENQVSGTFYRG